MTKKIFQSILLVAGCVLLASLLIIMGFLYDYFGGVEENQLRDELSLASAAVEDGGTDYLSRLTADRCRLTWIAADGSVLYDTRTDAESLENHASRAEVSQALTTGTGESTRYSSTLMEKTMYYAQRLDDGTVLRISISRATVGMIAVGMIQPLLIVLIVALILSGLLARRLSRRIVDPLNSLDLEHPLDNDAYEELSPLLKRIHRQHVEIQTQLRELREKTDEFTQITGSMREGLILLDEHGSILSINAAAQTSDADSIYSFYKAMVRLRKEHRVISEGKIEFLYPDNTDLLAYRRYGSADKEELLVLCNLTEQEIHAELPDAWATAEKLIGNYADNPSETLRPYECVVLHTTKE